MFVIYSLYEASCGAPISASICLLGVLGTVFTAFKKRKRHVPVKQSHALDEVLLPWNENDSLTVRNILAGGIHAFGRTDGGKTSSMKQVAKAILKQKNSALLVLCPKKGEYREWLGMARAAGREDDVVLIDPKHDARFNMIGYWARDQSGVENVVRFIMEMRSVIMRESQGGAGESVIWRKYDETAIRNCVIALKHAGEEITAVNIHKVIVSAPTGVDELSDIGWQGGYCNEALAKGFDAEKLAAEQMDFEQAQDYLLRVWPGMGDRTRGSVLMGVTGTLSAMNIGIAREMFATATNITPKEAIEGHKIVIVNMPPDEYGDVGMLANIGWKYHWQKEVLRREITEESPIAGIWGDESSLWVSDFDSDYISRCRSYRGFMVYICQSLANYQKTLQSDKAEAIVESLLSNFSHKVFFALGDHKTAEWAANLCGKELQILSGGGVQHAAYSPDRPFQNDSHSSSFHEQYEFVVRPEDFMVGLRTGSPVNDYLVDAILVRAGKPFASGAPMVRITFDQRKS